MRSVASAIAATGVMASRVRRVSATHADSNPAASARRASDTISGTAGAPRNSSPVREPTVRRRSPRRANGAGRAPTSSSGRFGSDRDRDLLWLGGEQLAPEGLAVGPLPPRQEAAQKRKPLLGSLERKRRHRDGARPRAVRLEAVAPEFARGRREGVVGAEQQRHPVIELQQLVVVPSLLRRDAHLRVTGLEGALLLGDESVDLLAHIAGGGQP